MVQKVYNFTNNVIPLSVGSCLSMQDGGTVTGLVTSTGWDLSGTTAVNQCSPMAVNIKQAPATFGAAGVDALTPSSLTTAADFNKCWRSALPISQSFAAGSWSIQFAVQSTIASTGQRGAVGIRIWKSTDPNGVGAVEIGVSMRKGSNAAPTTASPSPSTALWTAPALTFSNEYLWIQCEWIVSLLASGAFNAFLCVNSSQSYGITTPTVTLPTALATIIG